MVSRTARAHPQPYRGPRPATRRVRQSRMPGWKVKYSARFVGTVGMVSEHAGRRNVRLIVYLQECGKFIIELPYQTASRIATMLRPFELPEPPLGSITYADGERIRQWLPGKRVWVRWTVYESRNDESMRLFGGEVIETIQEEDND